MENGNKSSQFQGNKQNKKKPKIISWDFMALTSIDLVGLLESEGLDLFVVLSGRRVQMDNHAYIDYVGHVCPYGSRLDTEPLLISNLFIKRVISEGYVDAADRYYCDKTLREMYLEEGIYSSVYQGEMR